jgi:hypothetical protein
MISVEEGERLKEVIFFFSCALSSRENGVVPCLPRRGRGG